MPSKTIEERAYALVRGHGTIFAALCRAIEAHDAFAREVSDAVEDLIAWPSFNVEFVKVRLSRFILPKPVDPLAEVADEIHVHRLSLEQALAKRGLKLVEVGDEL